jgi:CrcB protein
MNQWLAVAIGGALGSVMRFGLSTWVASFAGRAFPYGTLAVNILGCLAMGMLMVWLAERDATLRLGLTVGLLGGFTTFSAFSAETLTLMSQGAWDRALAYVLASVVLCLGAAWAGASLARQFAV